MYYIAYLGHQIAIDREFGEIEQGDLSDEEYATKLEDMDLVYFYFIGSDFIAIAMMNLILDINHVQ